MDQSRATRPRFSRATRWMWFSLWVAVGALIALGVVSLGLLALGPPLLIALALTSSSAARRSAWGLLTGAGLLSLVVAYLQRDGPGTTCWRTATGGGCEQHLDPRPWLVVGVALVLFGLFAQLVFDQGRVQKRGSTRAVSPR